MRWTPILHLGGESASPGTLPVAMWLLLLAIASGGCDSGSQEPRAADSGSLRDARTGEADAGSPGKDAAGLADLSGQELGDAASTDLAGPDGRSPIDLGGSGDADAGLPDGTAATPTDSGRPSWPPGVSGRTAWAAGVARRDLAPERPVHLGGYGLCFLSAGDCRLSSGIRDPISATALALADVAGGGLVVLVGVDAIGLVGLDQQALARRAAELAREQGYTLRPEAVLPSASHAHSLPDTVGLWSPVQPDGRPSRDGEYVALLIERTAEAVAAAVADLRDAELVWSRGEYTQGEDDVAADDHELYVLQARRPHDGGALATALRWSGHPTVYNPPDLAVSADYVGVVRARLEQATGAPALFLQGSLASVYPHLDGSCPDPDPQPGEDRDPGTRRDLVCLGSAVAATALAALNQARPVGEGGLLLEIGTFTVPLENGPLVGLARLGALPLPPEVDVAARVPQLPSRVAWVRLGGLDLLTVGGEASPSVTQALRAQVRSRDPARQEVITLGISLDWLGYILTREQWEEEDFAYHRTVAAGPAVLDRIRGALRVLFASAGHGG